MEVIIGLEANYQPIHNTRIYELTIFWRKKVYVE